MKNDADQPYTTFSVVPCATDFSDELHGLETRFRASLLAFERRFTLRLTFAMTASSLTIIGSVAYLWCSRT